MQRIKSILILVILALFCIVFLQNTQSVETRILFMTVAMPRAILLIITLLIGFVLGLIFPFFMKHSKQKKKEPTSPAE